MNGRILPLTYKVENGDQVEIITGRQSQPSRDWISPRLGYLASSRARAKVRNWFRHQDREQHRRQGREILDREIARLNVKDVAAVDIATQLKQNSSDALCIALGAGELTSASIAPALQHLRVTGLAAIRHRRQSRSKDTKPTAFAVTGLGDLRGKCARCCSLVPLDP